MHTMATTPRITSTQLPVRAATPKPAKSSHHGTISRMPSRRCPSLACMTMFIVMPVSICMEPSIIAPISTYTVSFSGLKSDQKSQVLSGLNMRITVGTALPKKPPVIKPMIKVAVPHSSISSKKVRIPPFGRAFFRTVIPAMIIRSPYPMSAIMMP